MDLSGQSLTLEYLSNKECSQLITLLKNNKTLQTLYLVKDQLSDTMRREILKLNIRVYFVPNFTAFFHKGVIFHVPDSLNNS